MLGWGFCVGGVGCGIIFSLLKFKDFLLKKSKSRQDFVREINVLANAPSPDVGESPKTRVSAGSIMVSLNCNLCIIIDLAIKLKG